MNDLDAALRYVLVQHENEGSSSPKGRRCRPSGGDFQGIGIYRSDVFGFGLWAALMSHRS
jgi:hypothetical protein